MLAGAQSLDEVGLAPGADAGGPVRGKVAGVGGASEADEGGHGGGTAPVTGVVELRRGAKRKTPGIWPGVLLCRCDP